MIPRDSLPPSSDCALEKLSKGVTALKRLAQRPDKELQATTATSTGLEAKLAGEVKERPAPPTPLPAPAQDPSRDKEQEGGHMSRNWLSRAASVTSFVSAPAVIGVLGLVLLQPPSGPRLLGPTHAGETAAQAATAMPYRVGGGRGSAGVEGGLYAEGTSKGDSKALAADLPAAATEPAGAHSEAIPKVEAIAAVPESEQATNLPIGSRSSEVSLTATVESFPDIPLPPTKVAEPFGAELAKQKQAQMHAVGANNVCSPQYMKLHRARKHLNAN